EKDFSMSVFVAPISRYAIVLGKVIGEGLVSFCQLFGIMAFGIFVMGAKFSLPALLFLLPVALLSSFVGASLGVLLASRINSAENAQRLFPFVVLPLMFLSGAFTPVNNLPLFLN